MEQWSRNYQFVTPRTGQEAPGGGFEPFQTFVMIAIARNDRDGLRLDGVPLNNPSWVPLTGIYDQYMSLLVSLLHTYY